MPQVTMPDGAVVEMPDQLDPALGARLRAFQSSQSGTGSGEPRRGATPSKVRAAQDARPRPITAFPELNEPTSRLDPLAAQNQGNADAGAALLNLTADSTVNLPGNLLGFGAKVAGQVGRNIDPSINPAQWRETITRATTLPRSARGDQVLGEGLAPVAEAWQQNVEPALTRYPLLGAAAETLGTAAEGAGWAMGLSRGGGLLRDARAQARAADISHKPYTGSPVADVAKRYTIVPDDVRHSAGMAPDQGITGDTRASLGPQVADSEVPVKNVRIATQRATQDLPGNLLDANGRVDAGLLKGALDAESIPYQQVAQLPVPPVNTLAGRVREAWQTRGGSLKGDAVAESRLLPLMDAEGAPLPTEELLLRWREINGYASALRKASGEGSAAAQIKGQDLRGIADAILDEIDARAASFGAPALVDELRAARTNIARLHALDDALDSVGWVDPSKLAAMVERHEPLSGGLAEVAADAAAAPRSLRPMQRAIDAQDSQLDRFGREPSSWLRNVVGHMGGNWVARRGIESLNRELRAGSGLLKQDVPPAVAPPLYPPNAGPQMPPQSEPPFTPWAGPLSLEPELPPDIPRGPFQIRQGRQLAEAPPPFLLEGQQPGPSALEAFESDLLPWEEVRPGQVPPLRGPVQSFADQLGPVAPRLDEALAEPQPGIPDVPSGINEAQLSSPALPRDLRVASGPMDQPQVAEAARRIAEMRRPKPMFGPDDEFPPAAPAAPVTPQGPPPAPAGGGFAEELAPADEQPISEMLYRGVPEGRDPMAPNDRGFTTWSNQRSGEYGAERYGPVVGEMPFDPSTNVHLGTLEDARMLLGLPRGATAQDIAEAAMRRFMGENRTASYDLPPGLDGTPREFIRFSE